MNVSPRAGRIRVLLADDHAVVRAGIRQFLERSGDIEVIAEAGDGLEACEQIAQQPPDVAVLDIQMPRRNGIETTRWLQAHHPNVGILILTAYDDEPYIQAASRTEAVMRAVSLGLLPADLADPAAGD